VPVRDGEISDFTTSVAFAEMCAAVRVRFPSWGDRVVPLCIVASGDGIAMTSKISGHPVSGRIVNMNIQHINSLKAIFRFGATARVFAQSALRKRSVSKGVAVVNQFAFQTSMNLIFEPFWPLTETGFIFPDLLLDGSLQRCLMVPYLVRFTGDLLELYAVRSMRINGLYGHLKFLLHKDDYGNSSQVRVVANPLEPSLNCNELFHLH
jgi:hypothetical protein